jgi:hypothetical protein
MSVVLIRVPFAYLEFLRLKIRTRGVTHQYCIVLPDVCKLEVAVALNERTMQLEGMIFESSGIIGLLKDPLV